MRLTRRKLLLAAVPAMAGARASFAAAPPLRIGLLRYGSVSWELDVLTAHGLDKAHGIAIETTEYAGSQATQVALQAHDADMIALDFLWVSRQRGAGADWCFAPISSAQGALVVPAASPIRAIGDLKGKRLGIAGSPIDKSWLILRAFARRTLGIDIDREADKSFAAPPLLAEALAAGRLDAMLTYWPYAAKAEAAGARRVIAVEEMMLGLGLPRSLPMVGYVFSAAWADSRKSDVTGFLAAAAEARDILGRSDAEWQRIAKLTGAAGPDELDRLRDWYRGGIPGAFGAAEIDAAHRLYKTLQDAGGTELTGPAPDLAPGTFWRH
jgi:NitT/TauT family transport system substrate-binding protein